MIGYIILLNIIFFLIAHANRIITKTLFRNINFKTSAERTASEVLNDFLIERDIQVGVHYSYSEPGGEYRVDKKTIHLYKNHENSKNIFHIFIALHEAHHAYQFQYNKPISVRFFRIWEYLYYIFNTFIILVSLYWLYSFLFQVPKVNIFIEILFTIIYVLYVLGNLYTRYWVERDCNKRTYRLMLENGYFENKKDRMIIKYYINIFLKFQYFCDSCSFMYRV
ncbi:zinc metallopeptidase [Bacillus thuringiensis]|uniref:zinc metallopeptidase n=1 Tax=Bacillus thuringiensis TaxID=1428 RepID=UPI00355B85C1